MSVRRLAALALLLAACTSAPVAVSPTPIATPSSTVSPSSSPTATVTPTPQPSGVALSAIQRLNERVGFVAGWTGSSVGLAKTTDAGATWRELGLPAAGHLSGLRFIDERVGWTIGFFIRDVPQIACQQAAPAGAKQCRGVVLRTSDGGVTWQEVLTIPTDGVTGEPMQALQAVDDQRAWVAALVGGSCGVGPCQLDLRRTVDGGKSWSTVFTGAIGAIRFASASRGWVATYATGDKIEVRSTSDGGATWMKPFVASGSAGFAGLDAATTNIAWLLTRDGGFCTSSTCQKYELLRTTDGGTTWSSLGNPKRDDPCFFGHLVGPLFASPARGWLGLTLGAGGAEGTGGLLATNDGGMNWTCSRSPENVSLLSAADPDRVWVAGGRGEQTLYASEDGGKTWRALRLK